MPLRTINMTGIEASNNLFEMISYINTSTAGILGWGILFLTFVVMFILTKRYEAVSSFSASAFTTAITAVFLRGLGIIGDRHLLICVLILAVIVGAVWFRDRF